MAFRTWVHWGTRSPTLFNRLYSLKRDRPDHKYAEEGQYRREAHNLTAPGATPALRQMPSVLEEALEDVRQLRERVLEQMAKSGYRARKGQAEDILDDIKKTPLKPKKRPVPKKKEGTELAEKERMYQVKINALNAHITLLKDHVKQLKRYSAHHWNCNITELVEAGRLPTAGVCTCGLDKVLDKDL